MKTSVKYLIWFVLAGCVAFLLRLFVVGCCRIYNTDMAPEIASGSYALISKLSSAHRGDVVLYEIPLVKDKADPSSVLHLGKVIGAPGDEISIRERKLYVNRKMVRELMGEVKNCHFYVPSKGQKIWVHPNALPLPAYQCVMNEVRDTLQSDSVKIIFQTDYFWILSKSIHSSTDSRVIGIVPKSCVRGVVLKTF